MWKNKRYRDNVKGLYAVYKIEGLNLDRFIESIRKKGIEIRDAKKSGNKVLVVTVNFKDSKKFFAIAKELCYNITKVKNKGKLLPFYSLYQSIGLLIGGIIFVVSCFFFNDFVLGVDFSGSGSIYKNRVEEFISAEYGQKTLRFSTLNLPKLEDEILAKNDCFSFVSCKKRGNRLMVELVLSSQKTQVLSGKEYAFYAEADGEIEELKVYRGTPLVNVGDVVKKGDLLVDGVIFSQDKEIKINVLAMAKLICKAEFIYRSTIDNQEEHALLLAVSNLEEREIIFTNVEKQFCDNEYVYRVNMKYRRIFSVG